MTWPWIPPGGGGSTALGVPRWACRWVLWGTLWVMGPGSGVHGQDTAMGAARLTNWPPLAADLSQVSARCRAEYEQFTGGLYFGAEWAWLMLDSWGRDNAGLFNGDAVWEGDYGQCSRIVRPADPDLGLDSFKAKYCFTEWMYTETDSGAIASCVPESCREEEIFFLINGAHFYQPAFQNLTNTRCYGGDDVPPISDDPSATAAIVILSIFAGFVVIGTLYDVIVNLLNKRSNIFTAVGTGVNVIELQSNGSDAATRETKVTAQCPNDGDRAPDGDPQVENGVPQDDPERGGAANRMAEPPTDVAVQSPRQPNKFEQILLAFSIYSNAPRILSFKHAPGSFRCLNGIRFLSMAWIVFGHTWQLGITITRTPTVSNRLTIKLLKERPAQQAEKEMHLAVEAFFILSAMLTTLSVLKQWKKMGRPNCRFFALYYFHRFWRLTPVYMLVLMFYATCFNYLGAGPLYPRDYYDSAQCKETWWKNLLYLNNLVDVNVNNDCMGWTWYLANDFQFYVIAPAFLAVLFMAPIAGLVVVILAIMIAVGVTMFLYHGVIVRQDTDSFYGIYVKPYARCMTYFIGMLLGYALYRTDSKAKMHPAVTGLGWCGSVVLLTCPVYLQATTAAIPWSLTGWIVFITIQRLVFGLGVAWVIWACCTGYGGFVNTLLSWDGWLPLARLTYVGYLVHPIIIFYTYFSRPDQLYLTDWLMVNNFLGFIVLTMGVSFVVSLVLELPFLQLEKVLIPRKTK